MKLMRILLSLVAILMLAACDSGGGGSDDLPRSGTVPGDSTPDVGGDDDDDDSTPPPVTPVDGNLYLPTTSGIRWHYATASGSQLTAEFDGAATIGSDTLGRLVYSNNLVDYVLSMPAAISYGGLQVQVLDAAENSLKLDIQLQRAHQILGVDTTSSYSGVGRIVVEPSVIPAVTGPYNGTLTALAAKNIATGELGALPAQGVRVMLNPGGVLGDWVVGQLPEYLRPLLERRTVDLWFSPGIGIVQRVDETGTYTLRTVDGIQQPLVFEFPRGSTAAIASKQMLVNGEALTHMDWTMDVLYRTSPTGWLDLEFEGSGSWFASLSRQNQPAGLHAATIRVSNGGEQHDIPVVLYVR